MNPRVNKILQIDPPTLLLEFTNGEVRRFDCGPYLELGVFQELKSQFYFRKAVVSGGTVVWPHEQDFCPDTLYLESLPVQSADQANCHFERSHNPKISR